MEIVNLKILDYEPRHQPYFENLNREWIEKDFVLEPLDIFVLTKPEEAILQPGGAILMASVDDEIVGTAGLRKLGNDCFEFTKMAVTPSWRGKGIGEALARAAIEKATRLGASKLVLYSQTCLPGAVPLYKKIGFKEIPLDKAYSRCDIKMGMKLDTIKVMSVSQEDASIVAAIGKRSFYDTFKPNFRNVGDLITYLDQTYGIEKVAASIKKPNNVFLIALYQGKPAGFAKLKKQSVNKQVDGAMQTELQKIYVLKEFHGSGVANKLMQKILELTEDLQSETLWLDVLVSNERARQFYEKHGFAVCGKHLFIIGSQEFSYHIMSRPVAQKNIHSSSEIIGHGNL